MVTQAPITPEVNVLITYPLTNDHIFISEISTFDTIKATEWNGPNMVRLSGNITTGSGLYILEDPDEHPFLDVGYFSSFDLDDQTATFRLVRHPNPEEKKIKEDIMSNPDDYELYAKLTIRIMKNGHIELNKGGGSFFFLKNKRYIISKEIKLMDDGKRKQFITWTER